MNILVSFEVIHQMMAQMEFGWQYLEWLKFRYSVDYDFENQIFPLNGTREGLFNAALALCPETKSDNKSIDTNA